MSVDVLDRGKVDNETEEMRKTREEIIANSPKPQFFKLRAQLLDQGRSNQWPAETENMSINLKVYAGGGENGLHNHTGEDHFHLVLSGSACFYGPNGEEKHCGPYEGVMLPSGCYYRFLATSKEPLVLLRVGCRVGDGKLGRFNVYGKPLKTDSKENGRVQMIPREGAYWGAPE